MYMHINTYMTVWRTRISLEIRENLKLHSCVNKNGKIKMPMAHIEHKGGILEMWLEKEVTQDKKIIYIENLGTYTVFLGHHHIL